MRIKLGGKFQTSHAKSDISFIGMKKIWCSPEKIIWKEKYRKQSIVFGDILSKEFKSDGRKSAGVKEQGVLVLAHSGMPSVLVEPAYINNAGEEDYLNSEAGQDAIVRSILAAIKAYKKQMSG